MGGSVRANRRCEATPARIRPRARVRSVQDTPRSQRPTRRIGDPLICKRFPFASKVIGMLQVDARACRRARRRGALVRCRRAARQLRRRVAVRTESQIRERAPELERYLDRRDRPERREPRLRMDAVAESRRRRAADAVRAATRGCRAADRADLRPRRRRRGLRRRSGAKGARRGRSASPAGAGTGAAPPTTRASTRSTSPRSRACSMRAGASASTRSC